MIYYYWTSLKRYRAITGVAGVNEYDAITVQMYNGTMPSRGRCKTVWCYHGDGLNRYGAITGQT